MKPISVICLTGLAAMITFSSCQKEEDILPNASRVQASSVSELPSPIETAGLKGDFVNEYAEYDNGLSLPNVEPEQPVRGNEPTSPPIYSNVNKNGFNEYGEYDHGMSLPNVEPEMPIRNNEPTSPPAPYGIDKVYNFNNIKTEPHFPENPHVPIETPSQNQGDRVIRADRVKLLSSQPVPVTPVPSPQVEAGDKSTIQNMKDREPEKEPDCSFPIPGLNQMNNN